MLDVFGDLWTYPAQARVITTNGDVRTNGNAVMGAGCALEARERYCDLQRLLGECIQDGGNHVYSFFVPRDRSKGKYEHIISFPVKHHWRDVASMDLIVRSAHELVALVNEKKWTRVVLPRPGVGAGRLDYEDVRITLGLLLDERFHVITFE